MKKSLAILMAAIVLVMAIPFSASAASTDGYYTYEISGGEATIIDVDENISGYVIVPSKLGGYPVTTIGEKAFYNCIDITKVAIPGSVKTIGKSAFSYTSGLTEAIICSGVATVGEYCFNYSSVIKIYLSKTVDVIGYAAWDDGASVFYEGTEAQLQAINRPNKGTITDIFRGANIVYNQTVPTVSNGNTTHTIKTEGYYKYMVSGGEATIIDVDENISGYVIVPSTLGGYPVTTIGANAFESCEKITKVAIPGCVKTIGKGAFSYTSGLTEAIICSGVATVGEYCFSYSGVIKIYLPKTVDTIGYAAWSDEAVFYEGTEAELQAINRPNKGTITDIFRGADISYNQTIPTISTSTPTEPSEPNEPDNDANDNGGDNVSDSGFSFETILNWFLSIITAIVNFITQLLA